MMRCYPECDIVIMSAAVCDYRAKHFSRRKIKKGELTHLQLEKTPDILAELGKNKGNKFLVGFALETENLLENARKKMIQKNVDLMVANTPNTLASDFISGAILDREGIITEFEGKSKREFAIELWNIIVEKVEKGSK